MFSSVREHTAFVSPAAGLRVAGTDKAAARAASAASTRPIARVVAPEQLDSSAGGAATFLVSAVGGFAVQQRRRSQRQAESAMGQSEKYAAMVAENRMITVQESQIRYAGAALMLLYLIKSVLDMKAAGVFDYGTIAGLSTGMYIIFETGRQSI
eukprot:TRINITY_DN14799_c0_g2_i1.p1 TRINITY_DN14799_c0_g2~~TRINITY_DN14799_c0_g2_i1.p1  ORF type:complete len:154 (+),score=19.97 TRINITY_DN14799_c0_g2_i1:76-537(+)